MVANMSHVPQYCVLTAVIMLRRKPSVCLSWMRRPQDLQHIGCEPPREDMLGASCSPA